MRTYFASAVVLMVALVAAGWWCRDEIHQYISREDRPILELRGAVKRPNPQRYAVLVEEAERWRKQLLRRFREAEDAAGRRQVIREARSFLERILPDMMRCWQGTPWDFEGHCETPGSGSIACGYFVATVLRDVGFRVDRYRLARQASQNILRTFLPPDDLSLRVGVSYSDYVEELGTLGPGIRLVGLDTHIGFLVSSDRSFRFIHASASSPRCVVDQGPESAGALRRSNYRVQGNLTGSPEVVEGWLRGRRFRVAGR